MAFYRFSFGPAVTVVLLLVTFIEGSVQAQSPAPSPGPISDGTSIDQGVAYMLMLLALVLTYLIHPLDASSSTFRFF